MKLEKKDELIRNEYRIYRLMDNQMEGFAKVHAITKGNGRKSIVLDLLGPSVEHLFNARHRRFKVSTLLLLAGQMIKRLKDLHRSNIVHRNIRPEHFVVGRGASSNTVFLVDFAEAEYLKSFHFCLSDKIPASLWYASINAHRGFEQSRRDDMESLGYVLIYFWTGSLPWQGLSAINKRELNKKILAMKTSTPISKLCEGLPIHFTHYMIHCRKLAFGQLPDYDLLSELFRMLRVMNHIDDHRPIFELEEDRAAEVNNVQDIIVID
ncbi:casein kinase 1, alpha 1-like protein [Anopheles sinensis]|uniref:Casein kinase 1, alpha 1-like protein n=1 Tax=Anopheles sinensis TaxID=74873 RepID=A0A084VVJ2_ANOSI|nr:casein kinase 1, alpha 1-like protein [Anopheles sinensis]